jgi:SynChlorMet cassette radical SAM/SPASM protein ScmE
MASRADLPTERWLAFFAELGGLAVQRAMLSGGEVFTRPDLFDLIDGLIANRMRYSLLTNATLITEKVIAAFEVGKRRLRLDSIQVSIDGSCAEIHDRSRPPASFGRALRGLRLLKQADLPVTVRVTINRHNVNDLPNIARLLLEDLGLPGFGTNEATQFVSAQCWRSDIALNDKQRKHAMVTLLALNEKYKGAINASAGPLATARHFSKITAKLARGDKAIPGRGTLRSCNGVFKQVAVLHDGTIVPCNKLPTMSMGRIGETPLKEVWVHSPAINAVRELQHVPLQSLPACNECPYTGFCAGGCPATVYGRTGQLVGCDPLSCYRVFRQEELIQRPEQSSQACN